MKWFNMVNPQETMFDIILDIYKKEKWLWKKLLLY
jgi:hypothetical protein